MRRKNNNFYIYLDIDGVLATENEIYYSRKTHPKYKIYPFNNKCVKVFNEIVRITNPIVILSSDWKLHFTKKEMDEIFKWNGVNTKISDTTPSQWGTKYTHYDELEACRASEILEHVKENKITKFVAIDDLDISPWLEDYFIHTPRLNEGIKQCGVFDKIINKFNEHEKE